MKRINCLAGEPQFVDHLAAVWKAFPKSQQGIFWVRSNEAKYACERHGIHPRKWVNRASPNTVILCASLGDLNRIHNAGGTSVLMEHGAGQTYNVNHGSYAGGKAPARDANKLFLVPGVVPAKKLKTVHPDAKIYEIGCPKLDRYVTKEKRPVGDKPKVAISFHWNCNVTPETSWAFPYFKQHIKKLAKSDSFELYGHSHPRGRQFVQPFFQALKIPFLVNFDEVLKTADVYVCDNSSTIFEAAASHLNVVLLNSPKYRKNINHGLRFWECSTIGPQVETTDNLEDKIWESVRYNKKQYENTEKALNTVYTIRDGTSSKIAAEIIRKEMLI